MTSSTVGINILLRFIDALLAGGIIGKNNTSGTVRQTHARRVPEYFQFGIGLDTSRLIPFGFRLPLDPSLFLGGAALLESQFLLGQAGRCICPATDWLRKP